MVSLRPQDPELRDMFRLELHSEVFDALGGVRRHRRTATSIPPSSRRGPTPARTRAGQRAAMARAIAQLRRVAPLEFR